MVSLFFMKDRRICHMMDYGMFKEIAKEKIKDYMPPEYKDASVKIISVNKVNRTKDALSVRKGDEPLVPNLYLEDFYKDYKACDDLQAVLSGMAEEYVSTVNRLVNKPEIDMSQLKDRVVMMLINTEQNKEMLADMPHKEFQDLSVIYRYVVAKNQDGVASIKVSNEMMKLSGMTPEDLFRYAAENTKKMFPPRVCRLEDILLGTPGGEGMAEEFVDLFGTDRDPKESLWVISNSSGVNGAVSMLYEENLHKLAEKMGTDLYIMPSSVHEVLAVSVKMGNGNLEELSEMVQQANMSVVELEERLSNNVYHYDKDLRELKLATQAPNKRLDGVVAEPELIYGAGHER